MKSKKLSIICATLACLILTSNAFAQQQQSFIRKVVQGGTVYQALQMSDGSYAYLNYANGLPTITKVNDLSGNTISEALLKFDLPSDWVVPLVGMAQTSNGFVLVGWAREGYYGIAKGILVKVNMEGRVVWNKLFSAKVADSRYALHFHSVIPTAAGGFIVTGSRGGYPVVIRFSSGGNIRWSKSFESFSSFLHLALALDGGFILATDLIGNDGRPKGVNVLKMNGSGKLVWGVTLEMKEFEPQSLTALSDQGFLLVGKARKPSRLLLVRLNADGTLHSKAAYSLDIPDFFVTSLAETPDGGIAISGYTDKRTGSLDKGLLLKINDRLRLALKKTFGFPDADSSIDSVFANQNGSYLLFGSASEGFSYPDTLFVGLNSDGAAPGCTFFHHLKASKVKLGKINHKTQLAITLRSSSIRPGKSFNVTSEPLNREISNVCAN